MSFKHYYSDLDGRLKTDNTREAAFSNTYEIQRELDEGGTVAIFTPGTYYINDTLTVYSNTEILLGADVVLKQYAGTNKTMFRNANYAAAQVTATGNITTATTGLTGNLIASVSVSGLGISAGDYVYISGDTSGAANGTYNGIHLARSYDGTTLTFLVKASATVSDSSGTIKVAPADANITLRGGVLDYDSANNSGATGNNTHMVVFNQCGNVKVISQEARNALKYCYYFGSFDGVYGNDVNFLTGSDGFHFAGPGSNVQINNLRGETGDDLVAFTTANGTEFSSYDLINGDGDISNIEITNLQERQSTNHRCVLLEAVEGYTIRGVKIDGVQCMYSGYIAVMLTARDTYSGTITDVSIKNVSGGYGLRSVGTILIAGPPTSGTLTVGSVDIDGVYPNAPTSGDALVYSSGRVTGGILKMRNVVQRPLSLKSTVKLTGSNVSWKQIIAENMRGDFDAANAALNLQVLQLESGTFTHVVLRDSYVTTSGTNTQPCQFVTVFSPAAQCRVDIENCYHDGYTYAFKPATITNVPTVRLSGTKHNGVFVISGSDSFNLIVDGIEIIACSGGTAFNTGATSKTFGIHAYGIKNTGGVALWNYGTTNTFNVTGADGTVSLKTDTAGHTFNISAGAILRDTQAASPGLYAQGITTYTRLTA